MIGLVVDTTIDAAENLYGKVVSDLQEDIEVNSNDTITGTLKYVSSYDGWSSGAKGNFIALHFSATHADSLQVKMVPSEYGLDWQTLDSDGLCVFQVHDNAQTIGIKATYGSVVEERYYRLEGLTLTPAS